MKYSKFVIKNYKGIKELVIDFEKGSTKVFTLVGLNESGKTSILEALNLIQVPISSNDVHTLIPKSQKLNFNDSVSVTAYVSLEPEDEALLKDFVKTLGYRELQDIKVFSLTRSYKFVKSEYEKGNSLRWDINLLGTKKNRINKTSLSKEEENKVIEQIRDKHLPSIIYYPDFLFNFPARIYLEETEDESNEQDTYREVLSDILDTVGGGLNIEEHLVKRMKSSKEEAKEALESTIIKVGSKITKRVFDAWEALFDSKGKEIILKPGIEEKINDGKVCYIEIRLKEKSSQFQIAERSLGFKWFFTFLLFTEFRKNRTGNKGEILFLLDEPASNLHSTAQKKLLATFEKLVSNCKLIYTTHSHHLINPKWLNGAYIIRNKAFDPDDEFNFDSENTDIEAVPYKRFAAQHPDQRTYFQPILDSLDYQPGLLEDIPNIIVTEGKNDYYTFKYFQEVILKDKSKLFFYPGGGADRNDQVIALYLSWNRDFKILLDGDKAGDKAKTRYVKEFGEEVKSKIFLLKDINFEFQGPTEHLFSNEDKIKVTQYFDADETKFDKSKFNTAIQNLLISKKEYHFSKETLQNFKQVLEFLKKN
jgi:energy-coupling factor transporter ATP-binding protein EcfA2